MAPLSDCIYAIYVVMIIPLNNVHLFQQQSDKLYLCCTFGLLAWTLLSNVSQLGLLLTRKPSKQLSSHQCFLDIVLFKSTTKGHFLTIRASTLLPFSSSPSSSWPKKTKRILSYISCMPSVSTASPKHYQGWLKKLNSTTQLEKPNIKPKHLRNPTTTRSPSGASGGADWKPRNIALQKQPYIQISPYCSHTTASLSSQDCWGLWTARSRNINATSVFQRNKRGIETYLYFKYVCIYICMHTHAYKPLC